jgi:hypothetical protein
MYLGSCLMFEKTYHRCRYDFNKSVAKLLYDIRRSSRAAEAKVVPSTLQSSNSRAHLWTTVANFFLLGSNTRQLHAMPRHAHRPRLEDRAWTNSEELSGNFLACLNPGETNPWAVPWGPALSRSLMWGHACSSDRSCRSTFCS